MIQANLSTEKDSHTDFIFISFQWYREFFEGGGFLLLGLVGGFFFWKALC